MCFLLVTLIQVRKHNLSAKRQRCPTTLIVRCSKDEILVYTFISNAIISTQLCYISAWTGPHVFQWYLRKMHFGGKWSVIPVIISYNVLTLYMLNFCRKKINIYLQFNSLFHIDVTQDVNILSQVRPWPTYSTPFIIIAADVLAT